MVLKLNTIITKYQNVVDYVFGSLNNDKMQTIVKLKKVNKVAEF